MTPARPRPRSVAVIGGGISGLAAAHRLTELAPDVRLQLFEASDTLGGALQTEATDGFLIERGSDSFITDKPWALDLCTRIGFAGALIPTTAGRRQSAVVRRGRLQPIPAGFHLMAPANLRAVLTTPILSPLGKLRVLGEYLVPAKRDDGDDGDDGDDESDDGDDGDDGDDESLAAFARRRLGREAFERLVQPLASGIYTADAETLSLRATLPRFIAMEREAGGLIRAVRKQARQRERDGAEGSGARYSLFMTPQRGLASMVDAIAARLPDGSIALESPVLGIARHAEGGWSVRTDARGEARFDGIIVALGAPAAARLLRDSDRDLAAMLDAIPYAGATIVTLAYERTQIAHPLDGFGFVVPEIERRPILAATFSSVKFAGRAPAGKVLLRAFVGGAKRPEMVDLPDDELLAITRAEIGWLIGVSGPPLFWRVHRHRHAMPQYRIGHLERVSQLEARAADLAGLELAGNAYRGVGIPDCIHSGEQAVERLLGR